MADLLGSILGSMEKPPTLGEEERKKRLAQKRHAEKLQQREREKMDNFRLKMQKKIQEVITDASLQKYKFAPMDAIYRSIIHEVADVAGLTSFSFGQDEVDRYVIVWKKEYAPSDEELAAYRNGEEWDPEKAKQLAKQKEMAEQEMAKLDRERANLPQPAKNYKDKYEHLIGKTSAKEAAIITMANTSYGFVPSENKRDSRTIEQVMADSKSRKKLKTDHSSSTSDEVPPQGGETKSDGPPANS